MLARVQAGVVQWRMGPGRGNGLRGDREDGRTVATMTEALAEAAEVKRGGTTGSDQSA